MHVAFLPLDPHPPGHVTARCIAHVVVALAVHVVLARPAHLDANAPRMTINDPAENPSLPRRDRLVGHPRTGDFGQVLPRSCWLRGGVLSLGVGRAAHVLPVT